MTYATQAQYTELSQKVSQMSESINQLVSALTKKTSSNSDGAGDLSPAKTASEDGEDVTAPAFGQSQANQLAILHAQKNDLQTRVNELERQSLEEKARQRKKEVTQFVESQISTKKIRPADRTQNIAMLLSVPDTAMTQTFQEGKAVNIPTRQMIMNNISTGPDLWDQDPMELGEQGFDFANMQYNTRSYGDTPVDDSSARQNVEICKFCEAKGLDPNKPEEYLVALADYTRRSGVTI